MGATSIQLHHYCHFTLHQPRPTEPVSIPTFALAHAPPPAIVVQMFQPGSYFDFVQTAPSPQELSRGKEAALTQERERSKADHQV